MTEDFLQYVWKNQLFEKNHLLTDQKEKIEIILPGASNQDAGPDFTNARIRLNNTIWVGNIEIHTESSLWMKHKHHTDPAYDNVILHVVYKHNGTCKTTTGRIIPTLKLDISENLQKNFSRLKESPETISCSNDLHLIDSSTLILWFEALRIERLKAKATPIQYQLVDNKGDWNACFHITIASAFGMKTNALPFELLAKSTPFKLINKYHSNLFQLEALLFGQAGFLEDTLNDTYHAELKTEYNYLKKIHHLKPIDNYLWKFLRLRPANFPTIRLAQFAKLLHQSEHLFSKILEADSVQSLQKLLNCSASKYWANHYNFGKESKTLDKKLGITSINSLIINTIIPFLFLYGRERQREDLCSRALVFQEDLPAENNRLTRLWKDQRLQITDSSQTQAIIQLIKNYCSEKNCLYCHIGNAIIQRRINETRKI